MSRVDQPPTGIRRQDAQLVPQEAEAALGVKAHSSFASNSRVFGKRSRVELGWEPKGAPILEEIERGHYRRVHGK